jgi:dTDP-L-rhamnose 4-epimerase
MSEFAVVTGGAGLVGSHIVDLLLEKGIRVKIVDSLHPQTHPNGKPKWVPKDAEFNQVDVRDLDGLINVVRGASYVFHQASFGGFTAEKSEYFDVNVTGTARLFEAIEVTGTSPRSVVVATSQAIFGELQYLDLETGTVIQPGLRPLKDLQNSIWEHKSPTRKNLVPLPAREDLSCQGITPYALSKIGQEAASIGFGKSLNIPVACIRYGVTYGPRQSLSNPYTGVISIFSNRVRNGKPPLIYEDGSQTRDFVFVRDQALLNVKLALDCNYSTLVINSGTGFGTSMLSLAQLISRQLNGPEPLISKQFRPGDARHFFHSVDRLKSLGHVNATDLETGLEEYYQWLETQPVQEDNFEVSQLELKKAGVLLDFGV